MIHRKLQVMFFAKGFELAPGLVEVDIHSAMEMYSLMHRDDVGDISIIWDSNPNIKVPRQIKWE